MKQILFLSTILIFAASCVSNPETSSLASNEQDEKDEQDEQMNKMNKEIIIY